MLFWYAKWGSAGTGAITLENFLTAPRYMFDSLAANLEAVAAGEGLPAAVTTGGEACSLRATIGRELFPPPPAPPAVEARLSRGRRAFLLCGLVALGTALVLLRLGPGVFERIWGEDGPIYLFGAIGHGFWSAVFDPYAGYLVVAPRLAGAVAGSVLPLQWAATTFAVLAALLNAASGVAVWFGSAGQVPDRRLRAALVVAVVLAAASGQETLDSAAYAPWFMLVGTFWLLFLWPRTWWGAGAASGFVLLTALSTPGVWFFLPVALLRAASRPSRKAWVVLAGFGTGAIAQVPVVLAQKQEPSLYSGHIWSSYLQRVVDGGLLGQRLGANLWEHLGWAFLIVFAVLAVVGFMVCLHRAPLGARWFALIAIATSLAMYVVSVYQRGILDAIFWPEGEASALASRYVVVPAALLVSAAVVAVQGARWGGARRRSRVVWATVAALGIVVVVSFDQSYSADGVPQWRDALTQSADKCRAKGREVIGIPTQPVPFGLLIRCEELEGFATAR